MEVPDDIIEDIIEEFHSDFQDESEWMDKIVTSDFTSVLSPSYSAKLGTFCDRYRQ